MPQFVALFLAVIHYYPMEIAQQTYHKTFVVKFFSVSCQKVTLDYDSLL